MALQLSSRGIAVHGIELSPHMAGQLAAKPGAEAVPVTIGDMATTRVRSTFRLVYLVANTIMNVTTQDDQLAVFANAAAHLEPGGCFVVEVEVPQLRRVPPGEAGWVFTLDPDHVGIETFDDTAAQIAWVVINGVARWRVPTSRWFLRRRSCVEDAGTNSAWLPAAGEAELPEFPGVAVVVVDRLIYGAGVDIADPVAVDRRCDVAEQPGHLRLW